MTKTFDNDLTKNEPLKILCSYCKTNTKHIVMTSINERATEYWDEYQDIVWITDYEIIQCLGCETISFRSHEINSENEDQEGRLITTILIYPKRSKYLLVKKNYLNLPINLERIYSETIDCFNRGNYILSGAGVRGLVEGLCLENGITEGNVENIKKDGSIGIKIKKDLQGKINGLHESGKLTAQGADILHEHRFLGNEAVHELTSPSKEDLSLAIEIVENVFETLYEIPSKGLKLKNKRLNK